ncbi:hypothetical protein BP00DRAFT_393479 [Aspergillus indologenus CBS 114.80]|uniref:Uncharacterized protein n=1 Tax=Aspergillus indologenus CBS 114.80 TaxID=1450541 RepID=A0A2V5IFF1_9EURO|nr:hypothetical protein BP00DRAFT_393479 [Aspergillus indologenus CBS 114.80]
MASSQRSISRLTQFSSSFTSSTSHLKPPSRRYTSTSPSPPAAPKDLRARLQRFNDRLPRFLRTYTTPLLGAPATHVTSFLILHELTAIVPLFGLAGAFHYGHWLPDLTASESFQQGTQRFQRWLRKNGWVDADTQVDLAALEGGGDLGARLTLSERVAGESSSSSSSSKTQTEGVRLVLEFATAYTVTKFLLPVRIAASVWATPWFARVVLGPLGKGVRGFLGRK